MAVASDIEYAEVRRQRREERRRQVRRRRLTALGVLTALAVAALFGLARLVNGLTAGAGSVPLQPVASAMPASPFHRQTPEEIRGVHITGPLMSLPGKFAQYLALKKDGLNTVEVDLKDESGNVSFEQGAPSIARGDGAARAYFDLKKAAQQAHAAGMYLSAASSPSRTRSRRPPTRSSRSTAATGRSGTRPAASPGSTRTTGRRGSTT